MRTKKFKEMEQPKQFYQALELPKHWFWAYFEDGFHFFQKYSHADLPPDGGGYSVVKVTHTDILSGNHLDMIERGLTR